MAIMVKPAHPPLDLGGWPDQKQDYQLGWPKEQAPPSFSLESGGCYSTLTVTTVPRNASQSKA